MNSPRTQTLLASAIALAALAGCRQEQCEGSVILATDEDVKAVLDCAHFEQLGVETSGLTGLELPNLVTVERDVAISGNARLRTVRFSALESVGGTFTIRDNTLLASVGIAATTIGGLELHDNLELAALDAPQLTHLPTGGLTLANQGALATLELPMLADLATSLELQSNEALERVLLPALKTIGGGDGGVVRIAGNPRLKQVELPVLEESSGNIIVGANARLAELALPALRGVPVLDVNANRALTAVSAPALFSVSGQLRIVENTSLASLDFAFLKTAGCVDIHENPALPDCEVEAVYSSVSMTCSRFPGKNKGDGCP